MTKCAECGAESSHVLFIVPPEFERQLGIRDIEEVHLCRRHIDEEANAPRCGQCGATLERQSTFDAADDWKCPVCDGDGREGYDR